MSLGRPDDALTTLSRLRDPAAAQDRIGDLIEIEALRALALADLGDDAGALDTLARAVTLAAPLGHVRVFVDEGPPMAELPGTW
ncbi:MAG: hypothetical protein R2716_12570 [Microthrixaceae bacterium]